MRARIALVESGINCVLREVDLKNKPASMLKISPKGTVPVLLLPEGRVIEQSMDIIRYAIQDHNHLADELITRSDTEFIKLATPYKYPDRYPDKSQDYYRQKIQNEFLDLYERMLEGQQFLLGNKSIADIAIMPMVRQFALVDPDWFFGSKYSNIIRWLKSFIETDSFKNIVMAKNPRWNEGDQLVYLLP